MLKPLQGECTCLVALSMVLISAHTTHYLLYLTGKQADLQPPPLHLCAIIHFPAVTCNKRSDKSVDFTFRFDLENFTLLFVYN